MMDNNSTPSVQRTLPILLASGSPRRQDLLQQIGIYPKIIKAVAIDESITPQELPRTYVQRIALQKLLAAEKDYQSLSVSFILVADTIASVGRRILTKPSNRFNAENYLQLLSGRRHRVYSCVILKNIQTGHISQKTVMTVVQFARLTDQQMATYLDTQEWMNKAGGYAIQGMAASFIKMIRGSHSNVVGLPLFETAQLLRGQRLIP